MIIDSIKRWEPRIAVDAIEVSSKVDADFLADEDNYDEQEKVLGIRILFKDPQNITKVDELVLEVPLQK
jgi:phage baseplate assembly protein W